MTTQVSAAAVTADLKEKLHTHFIRPEDRVSQAGAGAVFLTEVTAPGPSNCRADAVHVGLWQSRGGGRIDVCELKVTRSDWLRELKKPEKAEAWWRHCNAFWLVVPTADIVREGELPPGWGLMTPGGRGRRFKVITAPEEREPVLTPTLVRTLLTSTETTKVNALRQQEQALRERFNQQAEQLRKTRTSMSQADRERLNALDKLEGLLGLKVEDYPWDGKITPETAAEGLRVFMQGQAAMDVARRDAKWTLQELDRAAKGAQEQADGIRKAWGIE